MPYSKAFGEEYFKDEFGNLFCLSSKVVYKEEECSLLKGISPETANKIHRVKTILGGIVTFRDKPSFTQLVMGGILKTNPQFARDVMLRKKKR